MAGSHSWSRAGWLQEMFEGMPAGGQCLSQGPTREMFVGMSTGRNVCFPIPAKNGK